MAQLLHSSRQHGQRETESAGRARPNPAADDRHPLLALQRSAGNRAVASLIQRVSIGTAPAPVPKKQWEVMGGFASKHLIDGALTRDTAKAKWTERNAREKRPVPNTVASKDDFTAAVTGGKVTGTYPTRTTRSPMIVEVKGFTVFPSKTAGQPGGVKSLSRLAVEGSASESLYFPDHFNGKLSS